MPEQPKTAISLDLDGVVFKRVPFQIEAFAKYFFLLKGTKIYLKFNLPSSVDRNLTDQPITSRKERFMYNDAQKRKLKKGIKEFIEREAKKADIFVNTGRPAKKPWVDMTIKRLNDLGIGNYFQKEKFFKPKGMRSRESKALAIRELVDRGYTNIVHYDDNPEDVLPLALMFPEVKFVIVQDLSTGILFSRKEAKKYLNVRRIARFDTEIVQSNILLQ